MPVLRLPGILTLSSDNSTLTFLPFRARDFNSKAHANVFRCEAENDAGRIVSTEVDVRAGERSYVNGCLL